MSLDYLVYRCDLHAMRRLERIIRYPLSHLQNSHADEAKVIS